MLRSPLIAPAAQDEVAILFVGFERTATYYDPFLRD